MSNPTDILLAALLGRSRPAAVPPAYDRTPAASPPPAAPAAEATDPPTNIQTAGGTHTDGDAMGRLGVNTSGDLGTRCVSNTIKAGASGDLEVQFTDPLREDPVSGALGLTPQSAPDALTMTVSDPPTQGEVQDIADKVDEILGVLLNLKLTETP